MPLPRGGQSKDDVLAALAGFKTGDVHHHDGRVFGLVFHGGSDVDEVLQGAASLYLFENGLNPAAFPSVRRLQDDILAITASLLGGDEVDDELAGFLSSGGTESILMAVKAAREQGKVERGITQPNMVLPMSAHAAFDKAAHYFGVEARRIDVCADYRADVDAMAEAVDDATVLLVGSAPQYPQGVVDPIPAIASVAAERDVNCHVDACMGGFVLPFLERLGRFDDPWDFRVPGVTSISADLHKYGYAVKGVSVIMYRDKSYRRHQTFVFDGWLGGMYASPGIQGTKPVVPIAAAWAVLHYLGEEGYLRLTEQAHDAARQLVDGVRTTPGLATVGDPQATLVAVGAADPDALDIFKISEGLYARGWFMDRQGPPDSLHLTCSPIQAGPVMDELVRDLRAVTADVSGLRSDDRSTNYAAME